MGVINWNKKINLYFYSKKDDTTPSFSIECPDHGRKPSIELTGNFTTDDCVPTFNITIMNLYMDFSKNQYQAIMVKVGYGNDMALAFKGVINIIYTESPGPESKTVIQCQDGNLEAWLTQPVQLNLKKGYKFSDALNQINKALGFESPHIDTTLAAQTDKAALVFNGTARDALHLLRNRFIDCIIRASNNRLAAFTSTNPTPLNTWVLDFVSMPPIIAGGADANTTATVTAPWNPRIRPGDAISFNSNFYTTVSNLMKTAGKKTLIIVTAVAFHFATTGRANQMTIEGYKPTTAEA